MDDPFDRLRLDVGGLTFDALTAGPDDGDLVLLLHGFPQTSQCWTSQLRTLAEAGYRVVAPDQRGYSPDARPADVSDYRIADLVGDVLGFADALGVDRFHLVGHDWGAAIGWQVAGRHAERLLTFTSVSVPHPAAFGEALTAGEGDQAQRSSYVAMFQAEGAEEGMLANDAVGLKLIYLGAGMTDEQAQPYLAALGTTEALGAALNWYRAASLTDIDGFGTVTTPTLYIWSTDDPALGREAAEATGRFVDGPYHFVVLEGIGHWVPEQAPDQVSALLLDHLAEAPT